METRDPRTIPQREQQRPELRAKSQPVEHPLFHPKILSVKKAGGVINLSALGPPLDSANLVRTTQIGTQNVILALSVDLERSWHQKVPSTEVRILPSRLLPCQTRRACSCSSIGTMRS